jgi:hypothetical protein
MEDVARVFSNVRYNIHFCDIYTGCTGYGLSVAKKGPNTFFITIHTSFQAVVIMLSMFI